MTADQTKILVVANTDDSKEICAMLTAGGFPDPAIGDGSDATLSLYQELAPAVVVVCANLDHGDAQSLVASMRGAPDGDRTKIILIGETRGPIRNALDAADFGVDRFLGRPLSGKALAFSVRTSVAAQAETEPGVRQGPALLGVKSAPVALVQEAPAAPVEAEPPPAAPVEAEPPPAAPVEAGPPPVARGLSDRVERAVDLAIEDFVTDAIDALGDMVSLDVPMIQGLVTRPPEAEPTGGAAPAADPDVIASDDGVRAATDDDAPPDWEAATGDDLGDDASLETLPPAVAAPAASTDDLWEEPPPPIREPTLILSGGGAIPPPVEPEKTEKRPGLVDVGAGAGQAWADAELEEAAADSWSSSGWTGAGRDSSRRSGPVDDGVDALVDQLPDDDLSEHLGPDLVEDIESEPGVDLGALDRPEAAPDSAPWTPGSGERASPGGGVVTEPASESASAGAFARELRRKMSKMAERLFGDGGGGGSIDVGLAHDHQTEIDLTSIGDEEQGPMGAPVAYEEFGAAETFADVGSARTPISEAGTGVSESGIIDTASPGQTGPGSSGVDSADTTTARRPMPFESHERGTIDIGQNDVASLLARLFGNGFTGELVLRRPPAEKSIQFDRGRPVFARSNLPHDRMGDLLFREGKITRAQHSRSRELVAESGRRMGEILIDMGFLKGRELLPAVRRHIEDIVYSLFEWDSGEFTLVASETAVGEKIRLSRHPAALVLEGIRRKYPLEWLERKLGSATAVVATADKKQLNQMLAAADLSRAERAVIDSLDGERSLGEVAEESAIGLLGVYQLAFGLTILGVAEVIQRGDDEDDDFEGVRPPSLVGETDLAIDRERVMAKHALVNEADYFTLLGVRRTASAFEIKRAYESARRDYAGDSFPAEVRDELGAEIGEINELIEEAYQVLKNDRLRASYLDHLVD